MRILMVNKFLYPRGGAETYMLKLGSRLESLGHQVEYFGMYDEKNTVGNSLGLYTVNMDFHTRSLSRLAYPFRILYSFDARKKMEQLIAAFRPDIIHLNNINFQLTPSIIDAAAKHAVPIVQTVHDYQMICPNHLLYIPQTGEVCQRCVNGSKWNCAGHSCIHGSRVKSILGSLEAILYSLRKTYRKVDLFVCPSRFLEQMLWKSEDFFRGKTCAIHNFIEPWDVSPSDSPRDYIAFAGRLAREKGVDVLAEAAKLLPQYRFVVMGDGPERHYLENIPNVELTGFLTGDRLRATIAGAALFVVPSVWFENCPLSILEAGSVGVPVVTVNMGGMAELIEDGRSGLLIDRPEPQLLAEALRRGMEDSGLRSAMSEYCLNHRSARLDLDTYCDRILEKYHSLLSAKETENG